MSEVSGSFWPSVRSLLAFWILVWMTGCDVRDTSNEPSAIVHEETPAPEVPSMVSEPLAPRADASPGPLFVQVPSEESGIDFINRGATLETNQRGEPINFRTNSGQHTAGGVCIGDYDGDKLPDVFLTRPAGGNRLYRNLGNFRFADVTAAAGVLAESMWGMGATFVDIDNDGDLDLYVCGYDCPNQLFVNRGEGTFVERAAEFGLNFRGASVAMAFMDYDRDGDLDGYLLTNTLDRIVPKRPVRVRQNAARTAVEVPEHLREGVGAMMRPDGSVFIHVAGQFDHLYRNDGAGDADRPQFADVSEAAGIQGTELGLSAIWLDNDDDGWPDLYVANDFFGSDRLYHNRRDGTFVDVAPRILPHTPWFSMGSDAGDINNDGKLDLMASDMAGTTHYKRNVQLGDLDAVRWFLNYPNPPQYVRNAVYLNAGQGHFMEIAYLAGLVSSDWTWSVKLLDMDNDGRIDVFVTNGMTRDLFNSDIFEKSMYVSTREEAEHFWQEQPVKRDRNMAFRNDGDLQFVNVAGEWGLDHLGVGFGAAWGDLDGDGDLDLVVNNFDEPAHVYRNQSSGAHCVAVRLQGTESNAYGVGALIALETEAGSQIRQLKLASGYMSADEPMVHFGLGKSNVISRLSVRWPSGHVQTFQDLPADRVYSIREPAGTPPTEPPEPLAHRMFRRSRALGAIWHREMPFDDFAEQPLLPNRLSQLGPGMAWGDIDGDGDDDLYVSGGSGQEGHLLRREVDGTMRASAPSDLDEHQAAEDMAPLFLDVDSDGDQDLYVVSGGIESSPEDRVYLNSGDGRFRQAAADWLALDGETSAESDRANRGVVCAGDFDRDGDLDLFVGGRSVPGKYPLAPRSRLLRNESGQFVAVEDRVAPDLAKRGMVTSAVWSDADNDGWLDLLVTYDWGPVRLFHNEQGARLADSTDRAGLADRLGWWNGIAGRDLDHDGDIDYVVTNFGLNTRYQASVERPVRIYYGDFDGSGARRIVEAAVTDEGVVPLRTKSSSERAMPTLAERFPSFESFASSSLAEIYSEEKLGEADVFEVNTLESGILFNDGQGRFTFYALPRLAQVSPSFGVALEDVNADGHPDIYVVQNFFGPQPETGRMDGGLSLLMVGDGQGNFTPVWPDKSGLVVHGDAKSLTVTDLNGDRRPDFVVGVNNGAVLAFENEVKSGRPLVVRLRGERGNLNAVGARVAVRSASGVTQTAEVTAGGGYLSQNVGELYFGLGSDSSADIEVRWPDGTVTTHPNVESEFIAISPRDRAHEDQ